MALRKLGGFWTTGQYGVQVFAEHSSGLAVVIGIDNRGERPVLRLTVQRYGPPKGLRRPAEIIQTIEVQL